MYGLLKFAAFVYVGWYLRDISSPETVKTMDEAATVILNKIKSV